MKTYLLMLPLLLAGCRPSTPLAGGEPALPGEASTRPRDAYDELSSLTFHLTGGFAGMDETLNINDGRITFVRVRPATDRQAVFTPAEMRELAAVLRRADFIKLVGTYDQPQLRDGFNETLTIQLGAGDKAKSYTVENYGDRAPAAYYDVTKYLRELIARKFPQQ